MKQIIWLVVVSGSALNSVNLHAVLQQAQSLPKLSATQRLNKSLDKAIEAQSMDAIHVVLTLGAESNACESAVQQQAQPQALVHSIQRHESAQR